LYITAIVHLAVLIILLVCGLGYSLQKENSFVLDFSKIEEIERLQKEVRMREAINAKLQKELGNISSSEVRNIAIDRSPLKDDRGTDAKELYKDAQRLQKELTGGFSAPKEDEVSLPQKEKKNEAEQKQKYSGPSVVSYSLEGRRASHLSIPAYRCMGAGEVTVLIKVDNGGAVVDASIDESCSSSDGCLRNFAKRAARLSKFSVDRNAPAKQSGNIVYKFVAQ